LESNSGTVIDSIAGISYYLNKY